MVTKSTFLHRRMLMESCPRQRWLHGARPSLPTRSRQLIGHRQHPLQCTFRTICVRGRRICPLPDYKITAALRDGAQVLSQASSWPFHLSPFPSTIVHDGFGHFLVPLWVMPGHQPPQWLMGIRANAP